MRIGQSESTVERDGMPPVLGSVSYGYEAPVRKYVLRSIFPSRAVADDAMECLRELRERGYVASPGRS